MTEKERKQLGYINRCFAGKLSVLNLAKELDVTPGGLGSRIVALKRKEYADTYGE